MNNTQKLELIKAAILVLESSKPKFESRRRLAVDASTAEWDAAANADFAAERQWDINLQNMYKSERLLIEAIMIEDCVAIAIKTLQEKPVNQEWKQ